jgi:WhiB family redox-sensing transcriptional regulator
MEWVHRAKCRDVDPELFFPIGTTGPAAAQIEAAKQVCVSCTVRDECLEWALTTGQDAGVWGGTSEEERRSIRRARRREVAAARRVAVAG